MEKNKEFEEKIEEIKETIKNKNIKHIYLNFVDFGGRVLTKVVGAKELVRNTHVSWFDGISLNGSLIEDFKGDPDSDWLVLLPDPFTFKILPFIKDENQKSSVLFCNLRNYQLDTRKLLQKAVQEFFNMGFTPFMGTQLIYSIENDDELQNFYQSYATNSNMVFHNQFVNYLMDSGIDVEYYMPFGKKHERTDLVPDISNIAADKLFLAKWFVENLGIQENKKIGFENVEEENISSCPVHISLWKGKRERNLFFDGEKENELSDLGKHFIQGILYHEDSIKAIIKSCTSYEVKNYATKYSTVRDDSIIQVPLYFNEKKKKDRIGWSKRCIYNGLNADCNYYLVFSALLYAGLYGINNIDNEEMYSTELKILENSKSKLELHHSNQNTILIEKIRNNSYFREKLGDVIIKKVINNLKEGE